ncbi:MAG: protein kinase [Gemmatimonadetes bacterium]|nr:protein kinase [Gemmatimonadota bacterium]NIO30563.1 protein kinase [Gemmatimonadota bacterium]
MSQRIGRYEVLETLGKGGMGVVYRARDPELDRFVAIKVVLAWAQYDADAMERFNREARVVAQMQHPHIVTVFDAGRTDEGLPYFVMEYLEGTDLGEVLGVSGSLSPSRAVRYVLQVCEGLTYAHAREIVHRDIKPANLLITPDDNIKIVDFGIAKLVGSQITGTGVSLGTPLYMAPEQVAGKPVDHRADIFAVGGVLYTLISGHSPFEAPTLGGICHKIETETPTPLSKLGIEIHSRLEAIILRALEKNPDDRYQSSTEMTADLRAVQAALEAQAEAPTVITAGSTPASPTTLTEPITVQMRRRPGRIVALLAVAVIAAAAALWAFPELRPWAESSQLADLDADVEAGEAATGAAGAAADSDVSVGEETGAAGAEAEETASVAAGTAASTTEARGTGAAAITTETPGADAPAGAHAPTRADTPAEEAAPAGAEAAGAGEEATPADADREARPTLYPAGAAERAAANRVVGSLVRAIEARDSTAIARLFGGRIPAREWRMFSRMFEGPRVRIRYELTGVGTAENGMLLAEVHNNILFQGQPGRVPTPRRSTWIAQFQSDKTGLYLMRVRPR